jgi:hypothetical protein
MFVHFLKVLYTIYWLSYSIALLQFYKFSINSFWLSKFVHAFDVVI